MVPVFLRAQSVCAGVAQNMETGKPQGLSGENMKPYRILGVLIGASAATIAMPALGQVDQGNAAAGASFGMVDQNTPGIIKGNLACGPTATYNSFVYLNNEYPGAGLGGLLGTGSVSAINEIGSDLSAGSPPAQGGVDLAGAKSKYISDHGLAGKVSVERLGDGSDLMTTLAPNAAAQFIAQQLAKGQDVEMGFLWCDANGNLTQSGHVVTVTGIDYDEAGQNGAMNIIDPWDGVALSGNLTVGNNSLVLGYTGGGAGPGGGDGQDPDNPTDAGHGAIAFVTAESLVPEPSIMALGLAMFGGLMIRRRAH
jgi:hypothetical protein